MTITGTNFVAGATVTIGGTPATSVDGRQRIDRSRQPRRRMLQERVDVIVANADGQSGT